MSQTRSLARAASRAPWRLARFNTTEVMLGRGSRWFDGALRVDLDSLRDATSEVAGALEDVSLRIVRPGEPIRIANVLDVVLPDVWVDQPRDTFPGALGGSSPAGQDPTNRLDGMAVVSVCDWGAAGFTQPEEFPDGLIDMSGPAQELTAWGETLNLVADCKPRSGSSLADVDRAVRQVSLTLARELAATTLGRDPSEVDVLEIEDADPDLPGLVLALQIASEGPLTDTLFYGKAVSGMDPTEVSPFEILDGALTNGAYDWAAVRNLTGFYQGSSAIRELIAAHGTRIRFLGVILSLGYLDTDAQKQRSARQTARLASDLGAGGIICTTFSSGNSHTDTMLTIRACEALGIRTVGLVAETNGGLTDHVPEADCLVSTGNEDELIEAWNPAEVLGSAGAARAGEPVPLWAYVGACVQTGDMFRMGAPAR